ncbi:hypothetical protein BAQU_1805 [Bifidobacterium aquikefiri]|uniref:Uncharacterized protein n=1 Tax=Bifidobacterium aquikefiri TaxID=1653207 RepID=A0A261G1E9_9BIFI|nr:hypothetical protein BAQU_1805 [Bifidobacterium aquikefiri]
MTKLQHAKKSVTELLLLFDDVPTLSSTIHFKERIHDVRQQSCS